MQTSRFSQLVDLTRLQSLLEGFHATIGVGAGIFDLQGEPIICANRQSICTEFHRADSRCIEACRRSQLRTVERLKSTSDCEIACENGLRYAAAGIRIDGQLDAYLILGQYLHADDHLEEEFFRAQASRYGFETQAYLEALGKVPQLTREQVQQATGYLTGFCELLADTAWAYSEKIEGDHSLQVARNELQGSLAFLRTLVETIPSPIFYKDRQGRYQGCNQEFAEKILGVDRSQVIGKTLLEVPEIVPPSLARIYQEQDEQLLQRGGIQIYEAPVRCADGVLRYFEFHKSVYRDESGQVGGIVGVMLDVTQRVRFTEALAEAKESAESANRSKSQFLANISHEFRTPMNGVLGMTELVLESELTDSQRMQLGAVQQSARSLMMVLDDILDFSRIDAGKARLDAAEFQLQDCVVYAARMLAAQAAQKDLELTCRFAPDVPRRVLGDAGRLRQILLNLIGNAVKFTEQGRVSIEVEIEEAGSETMLHFQVCDTGIGVAAEKQQEVFGAFHRDEDDKNRSYGAAGMGLAICTKLVDLMQGRIWLESQKGQGSRFHFTIKVGVLNSPEQAPQGQELLDGNVLLVGPCEQTRRSAAEAVTFRGAEVTQASSLREAQAHLGRALQRGSCFNLVIVDDELGRADMETLANQLAQNPALGRPPVLVLARTDRCGKALEPFGALRARKSPKPILAAELVRAAHLLLHPEQEGSAQPGRDLAEHPLKVLVAEDNPVNQLLARELLTRWGHTVTVVPNGVQALLAVESESFDVVLMDIQMPEMDGLQATRALRQREEVVGGRTPIVAMTAYVMDADRRRCIEAGMDDYVSKPIDKTELRDALRRASRQAGVEPEPNGLLEQADVLADCLPDQNFCRITQAGGEDTAEPIDMDRIVRQNAGDADLVREMAELFVDECPRMLQQIQEALGQRDTALLAQSAHFLRGSLVNFTEGPAVGALAEIEEACRDDDIHRAALACDQLQEHLGRITPVLRSYARQGSPRL